MVDIKSPVKLDCFYGSTAFLIGPKRQVTMMLDPVRIYATAIYIASIIIALFCALYVSFWVPFSVLLSFPDIDNAFSYCFLNLFLHDLFISGAEQATYTFGNFIGVWCSYLVCQ